MSARIRAAFRLQRFEILASLAAGLVLAGSALLVWFRLTGLHVDGGCFSYIAGRVPLRRARLAPAGTLHSRRSTASTTPMASRSCSRWRSCPS